MNWGIYKYVIRKKHDYSIALTMRQYEGKYLVVGSTNHLGEVDSFAWNDPTLVNVNFDDYSTFILHFDAIPSQVISNSTNTTRIIARNEEGTMDLLSNMEFQILKNINWLSLLLSDHSSKDTLSIFIITSPVNKFNNYFFQQRLLIYKDDAEEMDLEYNNISPHDYGGSKLVDLYFEFFSSLTFMMKSEPNISMINSNDQVQAYFSEFSNFNFVFQIQGQHRPLAHTFYNAVLSFTQFVHGIDVIVLPHPGLVSPFDSVEVIIRDILGIESESHLKIPDWVDHYNTNRQKSLIADISQIEVQIDSLKQQIKERETEFQLIRNFQRVLYTQGQILIDSLISVFQSLGMKVKSPVGVISHDIELESADYIFVVDVLTLDSPVIERSALRQLNQLVESKEEAVNFSKPVKGVAIINYDIKTHPKERVQITIEEAADKYVHKMEFCLVLAPMIFEAYTLIEQGKLGKFELLSLIAAQSGIFSLKIQ